MKNLFWVLVLALGAIAWSIAVLFGGGDDGDTSPGHVASDPSRAAGDSELGELDLSAPPEARVTAALEGVDQESVTKPEPESPAALAVADLAEQIDMSIDGVLEVNRLMKMLSTIADHPIETEVDYSVIDNDYVAYRLKGMPEGVDAHVLIDPIVQRVGGEEYRTIRIMVHRHDDTGDHRRGAPREGPEVQALLNYDSKGRASRVAIMTKDKLDFPAARASGVDPYYGEYPSGAYYVANLREPGHFSAETMGFKDGHLVGASDDPSYTFGTTHLSGDLQVNPDTADDLLQKLLDKKRGLASKER